MDLDSNKTHPLPPTIENLSQAIFTVNRHAKTAINPKFLYKLKKTAIDKMIQEKKRQRQDCIFQEIRDSANSNQMFW